MKKARILKLIIIFLISTSCFSFGQSKTIEGVVIDANSKVALAFATIGVKGTTIGTVTNSDGRFILSIRGIYADSVLFCSYMGYKNAEIEINGINKRIIISLDLDTFTLDEIEIRPWQPWDYIWKAMQKIPDNYPQNPYMTDGYYSEYISENGVFLKFTEGITETYNPAYCDTLESQSKVVKARRRDELGTLQFMRVKIEKKYEKELRKAKKKGEEVEDKKSIDEQILSASFGGPEGILSTDPLRDTASFLDIRNKKKYNYFIAGYSRYYGEQVIIIGFETKGKYDHQRQEGSIYISLESDAIMAIEYDSEFVIPVLARPVIFLVGFGITNPQVHMMVHYKPLENRWYLNDISMIGGARLTKKNMLKKNDRSNFLVEMTLINHKFELEQVHEFPEEERIDKKKPLEEQVDPDPDFWKTYKVVRPAELSKTLK